MATTTIPKNREQVGFLDYVSYAAGDFGCNMAFTLAGSYFTIFFTQYMGISSLVFAGIMVFLKIWDAVNDPLIGGIMDSTHREFKRGKFRTFMFYGSFLLFISGLLCFLPVPGAPDIAKVVLCIVGYMLYDCSYTLVNVPYGSLLAAITPDPAKRTMLSSARQVGSFLATLIAGSLLPIIIYDANNELMGERLFIAALALGAIGFVVIQFCVGTTVERVQTAPEAKQEKFNYFAALNNFIHNRAAIGATLPAVAMFLGTFGVSNATQVMFQAYFQNAQVSGFLGLCTQVPMFVFMPFIGKIVSRWGKKESAVAGTLVSIAAAALMFVAPITPDNAGVAVFFALMIIYGLGLGIFMCTMYALIADAIDYSEWKTGRRDEGTTYSLYVFFRKLTNGLAPSLGLVIMVWLGYNEALGAAQPVDVALNMRYMVAGGYLVAAVLEFISLKFIYNLDKRTMDEMEADLAKKHAEA